MPRRLAVAKHAGGFDSLGWTLLGFLLGASLAVFALLHADMHGLMRPLPAPPPPPPAVVVSTYAPPAAAQLAGPAPVILQPSFETPAAPTSPPTRAPAVNALASAGAASARAAAGEARTRSARAASPSETPKPAPAPVGPQVEEDAAAAGMTSRADAAPRAQPAAPPAPDLY